MSKTIISLFFILNYVLAQNISEFENYLDKLKTEFDIEHVHADSVDWSNIILLDVREKEEHKISHLKNSLITNKIHAYNRKWAKFVNNSGIEKIY